MREEVAKPAKCKTISTKWRTKLSCAIYQPRVILACFNCVLAWRRVAYHDAAACWVCIVRTRSCAFSRAGSTRTSAAAGEPIAGLLQMDGSDASSDLPHVSAGPCMCSQEKW